MFSEESKPPKGLKQIMGALESVLFAAGEPVGKAELRKALGLGEEELKEAVSGLLEAYSKEERGLSLSVTKESLQLRSKPENYAYIKKALSLGKKGVLSKAGAEALAIVAYNGPVTRIDVDAIRGVNSAGALQRLEDQGIIEECGFKEAPGKPKLYRTTEVFLRLAGVASLEELPSYDSFNEALAQSEGGIDE